MLWLPEKIVRQLVECSCRIFLFSDPSAKWTLAVSSSFFIRNSRFLKIKLNQEWNDSILQTWRGFLWLIIFVLFKIPFSIFLLKQDSLIAIEKEPLCCQRSYCKPYADQSLLWMIIIASITWPLLSPVINGRQGQPNLKCSIIMK